MRAVLARVHLHRGELDRAADEIAAADELVARGATGIERVVLLHALHAEAAGRLDRAAATLAELWRELERRGLALTMLDVAGDTARIARRCGDRALGADVVEAVRRPASRGADSVAPAVLARCRGLVEGDPGLLARAATMLQRRRRPVEHAFAAWEAASLLVQRGAAERAEPLFDAAAAVLEPIGARALPLDVEGVRPPPGVDRELGWSSLTRSERNVVALVAEGLSNAEIAARLICSRRTVESHLHHVYTKLGTSSRVALAVEGRSRRTDA
jgi:DNA-binding CsgD family transcriptional regulator